MRRCHAGSRAPLKPRSGRRWPSQRDRAQGRLSQGRRKVQRVGAGEGVSRISGVGRRVADATELGVGVDVAVAAAVAEPVGGGELGDAGGLGVIPATSKAWIAPLSNAT